jgi:hypothetical protein
VAGWLVACGLSAVATPSLCQSLPGRATVPERPTDGIDRSSPLDALPTSSPTLNSLKQLFTNSGDGWFARVGGLGDGNGVAAGGGYRVVTSEGTLTTRAMLSTRESFLVSADWTRAFDSDGRWTLNFGVSERRDAQQLFSGTGLAPDTTATGYALNTTTADVRARWRPHAWLSATMGVAAVKPSIMQSSDDDITFLAGRYSPVEAAGLSRQPTFAVLHGGLQIDTRRGTRRQSGGRYAVEWRHYDDREDAGYAFDMLRVDLQQDIALGSPNRTLLLHALGQQTTASSASTVPFYFQPTLGGGRSLRAYDRQRFRDLSALLLQAEYQHRVHKYVSAAAFLDAGQVAPRLLDVRVGTLLTNYGVGLRLGRAGGPTLRTDIAFGGESRARFVVGFATGF